MAKNNQNLTRYMQVIKFLREHPDYYDEYELQRIKYYALKDSSDESYTRDIMREIYDELGILPETKNMYIAFQRELEREFGIEGKNIVEVGGGILPRLGKRIHLHQAQGTITVYDPRIGKDINGEERLILKRESFTRKTDLENCDLLVGLMPCKGAEPLIDQAIDKRKDFMLWFCEGGPHGDYYDFYEDEGEWLGSMMYTAEKGVKEQGLGKLMVKKLEDYSNYPIIYNQR